MISLFSSRTKMDSILPSWKPVVAQLNSMIWFSMKAKSCAAGSSLIANCVAILSKSFSDIRNRISIPALTDFYNPLHLPAGIKRSSFFCGRSRLRSFLLQTVGNPPQLFSGRLWMISRCSNATLSADGFSHSIASAILRGSMITCGWASRAP
jgi:hypothetical protein